MLNDIQTVQNLKEELDGYRPLSAEVESRIMQKFKIDWNYHSNNLEGNALTYGETKALLMYGITAQGKPLKDHFEITGHNEAIEWILDIVRGDRPMTESFIRQFHKILLKEPYEVNAITPEGLPSKKMIQVGEYKSSPNHVKTKTGEIFYFASVEETPALMNDLMSWYQEKKDELNPVILATEFHYRFIRIHPFDDGNGRVARLLMNFILLDNNYPPVIIKTNDKENYFLALRQADSGDIEPFIIYIAKNLKLSLEVMISAAKGEDIFDSDDAIKEFRLLQSELSSKASKIKEKKEDYLMTMNEYVDKVFFPILERIRSAFIPLAETMLGSTETLITLYNSNSSTSRAIDHENNEVYLLSHQGSALASIREGKFDSLIVSLNWTEIKQLPDVKASVILNIRLENCGNGVSVQLEPSSTEFDDVVLGKNGESISIEIENKLHSIMLKSITTQVKSFIK